MAEVKQHIIVTIDSLRAFDRPFSSTEPAGKIVETIKKGYVKNIDQTVTKGDYVWGSWISSSDNKRYYTTLHTKDNKRKFVEIRNGHIPHGGKTITEYEKNPNNIVVGNIFKLKENATFKDVNFKVTEVEGDDITVTVESFVVDKDNIDK